MPAHYDGSAVARKTRLLRFFAITDIHVTDKESPNQLIYLQRLHKTLPIGASLYSGVMLTSTQVLDAAVQTVNALHKGDQIDFGLSLGDVGNSAQYNELRWYIDVLDGKVIAPSSGDHVGADTIDYQKPFKAVGLDPAIPWYQALGNHDHFWMGSFPVDNTLRSDIRQSYTGDEVLAAGDALPILRTEWMKEFFTTSSNPVGHGFNMTDAGEGFACHSFVPKATVPVKVIMLDDTQREDDGSADIHGHGYLDQARWDWLKKELAAGDAVGPDRRTPKPSEFDHVGRGTPSSEYRQGIPVSRSDQRSRKRLLAG